MNHAKSMSRLAVLAAGIGVGAVVGATAGTASADPTESIIPDAAAAIDAASLLPAADLTPFGQDLAISFNGTSLFDNGGASATSAVGSYGLAIAYGDEASADSSGSYGFAFASGDGAVANSEGSTTSLFNTAIADGAGANALSNGGSYGTAIASGAESSAYSNGIGNFVSATGYNSEASAAISNYNAVFVNGADSHGGVLLGDGGNFLNIFGTHSIADTNGASNIITIFGNDNPETFAQNAHNIAAIFGDGSSATVGSGDGNIAAIFGDGSTAFAGFGNNGLAVVFGDLLSAYAPNGTTDIVPSLAADTASSLSASAVDASWLTDFLDGSWLTGLL